MSRPVFPGCLRGPAALAAASVVLAAASAPSAAEARDPLSDGRAVYEAHCAVCHGADGVPLMPGAPDLSRGETLAESDEELIKAIRFGIGAMPGFHGILEDWEILNVLFYIRSLER